MSDYLRAAVELRTNGSQWAAYEDRGNCVVLAGPGSGKTKVLTVKLARIVREDIRAPRSVACMTYSAECVRELRRRLNRLGIDDSKEMFLGTVHGFCLQHILGPYSHLAGIKLPEPFKVAGIKQQQLLFGRAAKECKIEGSGSGLKLDFDLFRRDNLDTEAWQDGDDMARLASAYERLLFEGGMIDFEVMVREAVRAVERHAWLRKCLQARFPVFVVDEYQDLGKALHRMVLALCFDAKVRLIAVGDPDQSIYGFNGAHPDYLRDLAGSSEVTPYRLTFNYRSSRKIVKVAKAVLAAEVDYQATTDDQGVVSNHGCDGGIEGETKFLVETILPDTLQRRKPGDILITFRTKREGDAVEKELQSAGHEYVKIGSTTAYPKAPLTRFVEEVARWCGGGWQVGDPKLSRIVGQWLNLQNAVDPELVREQRVKLVRFMFDHRGDDVAASTWLTEFVQQIMHADVRERVNAVGEIESFDSLCAAVGSGGPLERFTVRNLAGQAGSPDHLNLVTLHSSKGTEFPVVVLVGADEGSFPWAKVKADSAEEAEYRRLFYVGISRAQKELYILWSKAVPRDRNCQVPSRFLREIHAKLKRNAEEEREEKIEPHKCARGCGEGALLEEAECTNCGHIEYFNDEHYAEPQTDGSYLIDVPVEVLTKHDFDRTEPLVCECGSACWWATFGSYCSYCEHMASK